MRVTRWQLLLCLAAVPLAGCVSLRAEAVDVQPPTAERAGGSAKAQGRIAYVADGRVWEWADGATRPLTPGGQHLEGAAYSPDGKQIAVSDVGENHSDVFTLDASGNRLRQLTRNWSQVS